MPQALTRWRRGLLPLVILLALALAPGLARASATQLFVDASTGDDQGGANNCQTQATPCKTIGQAVSEAADGDEIEIAAGTYDEAITTGLDLSFVGSGTSGSSKTTIDSTGLEGPGLLLTDGGSVSDLTLNDDDSGIGGALQPAGGTVTAQNILVTTAGTTAGTDAIDVTGGTFDLSDSTLTATNNDADVEEGSGSGHLVVFDGSALEVSGGSANVSASTLSAVEGIALRVHDSAVAANVRDSIITSSGTEDLTGYNGDGWQAIEAAAGALTLTGDTVYNATVGNTSSGQPPADALTVEPVSGITTTIHNTILLSQNAGAGVDVDASEPVSIDHSSFTSVTNNGTTVTNPDDAGNIPGDPGLVSPATGDFSLTSGSALIGAGDPSEVQAGETDVNGDARALSCTGGVEVVDIGAVESGPPECPASAPVTNPGPTSYVYASHESSVSNDYDQFVVGSDGLLSQLSPFEAAAENTVGTLITAADAPQVYALEQIASSTVLQQYQIGTSGQLTPGTTINAPSGSTLLSAALSPDGGRLYIALSSGSGASQSVAIDQESVSAAGAVTAAGAPMPLPVASTGAELAVDDTGQVYALASHGDGSSTLHDYRANLDGTLTQEDSVALAAYGTLSVQPAGGEAVVITSGFYEGSNNIGGYLYPVGVGTGGALTAAPTIHSGSQTNSNFDNPAGSAYSPDGSTFYVANQLTVTDSNGLVGEGSVIAPFVVNADGSLTPETTTPDTTDESAFPNDFQWDADVVTSADGAHLYVQDDYDEPSSGTIDEFATGAGGALTLASGSPVATEAYQTSAILVTPPPSTPSSGGGPPPPGTTPTPPPTVTIAPPPSSVGSGSTVTLFGTITAADSGEPVRGASITVCPPSGTVRACGMATSAADGIYAVSGLAKGNWLVQVEAPSSSLFGASDHVTLTADTVLNFGLKPPVPLSDGVSFQTPGGTVSSGVPTINWNEPYGINMPVHVPTTEAPNTNLAFGLTAGIGSDGGATTADAGFNLAGMLLFSAHYGANGDLQSVSPPVVGQIDCTPPAGQVSPCALMSTLSQGSPTQASYRRAAARHGGGGPIAHAADCPPANGFSITPNKFGGVDINVTFPDGSVHTLPIYQAAIPATVNTGNYWQDLVLNLGVGAVNTVVGALVPEVGLYNAVVSTLNTIASLPGNTTSAQILASGGAIESILGAALNKETHGASYYFGNMVSGLLGQGLNTSASNGAVAAPQPDCPPKNGVGGGGGGSYTNVGGSFQTDPSGTIQTTHGVPLDRARVTITRSSSKTGHQTQVPNGSSILAPSNRRNPSFSSLLGSFGWDVTPGYYQVLATHPGCVATRRDRTAHSSVYAVPPPRVNLVLTLSCPRLRRAASRIHLVVHSGGAGSEQIIATVSAAHGSSAASALQGVVTFTAGGRTLTSVLLNRRRMAIVDLPHVRGIGRRTTARYEGNGLYAPAVARSG